MFSGAISIWKVRNALSMDHVRKGVELKKKKGRDPRENPQGTLIFNSQRERSVPAK